MMKLKRILSLMVVLVLLTGIIFSAIITAATYPYQDPALPVEDRVNDLLSRMTLDEKAGQMIQAERNLAGPTELRTYFLGSILNGGGNVPSPNNPTGWCDMIDAYQAAAMQTRLQIPFIYGSDAVHGHNNVYGATLFPHNIGIGATRDLDLVQRMAVIVANEVRATGVHWTFAPCITVPQNEKWGRTYEGFSEDTDLVTQMGVAFVKGVQGTSYPADLKRNDKIAACIKHYIGDGATDGGINEGNVSVSETVIRQKYLPPYTAAINAGAQTVMVSFNKISGVECHASGHYIIDILKNELKFDGLVISDYNGIDDNDSNYRNAVKIAVNAGVDMIMVANKWRDCLTNLKDLANTGEIPQSRLDDAVRRILRVKFRMGLFEKTTADRSLMSAFGSTAHRTVAREAVRKSLVLLKNNNNILPLAKTGKRIFVAGKSADNIGLQCGGWTMSWQGMSGNITTGTTILQGIRNVASGNTITYQQNGTGAAGNDLAIVVIGETPYAETQGDNQTLALDSTDTTTLQNVKNSGVPMIVILVSGRPMIINTYLNDWSAFVAAWLPGTEGQGVAEVLFGDYNFNGKLPMVWPQTISQVPISPNDGQTPLFSFGYGLTYGTVTPTATPIRTATPVVVTPTPVRITPTPGQRSAFSQIEAESFNTQSGIQTESCGEGGQNIGYLENGDYVVYNSIDFGSGATGFQARVASATSGGNIEIRLDSITGTLVGTCSVAGTGGWQTWVTSTCSVSGASGVHNLYLRFTGGSGYLFNLNWFKFASGSATPTSTPIPTPVATLTPTTARTPTPATTQTPAIVITPTPVVTPTPSPTPTVPVTPTPGTPGAIKVQFFNQGKTDPTNQLYLNFQLVNTGSSAVALSNVKIRYWYTEDGTQAQSFWCDYSTVGSGNVTGNFVKMGTAKTGADTYLELGFLSGAGNLNAGTSTQVQCRCAKSDWSNYTQTNDYSFNATGTSYADWTKVTGYVSGSLQWGVEP